MTRPLTPSNCDLTDFAFMPLDVARLFASQFHAVASDAEWRAGVTLWAKSWHQVPAGSLPDDDVMLARLGEFGRDLKGWRKVRDGALRGWVQADDGRLYHPVVAEKALEAWLEKLAQRLSSGAGNAKKYGRAFDPTPVEADISIATSLLSALDPHSRALAKVARRQSRKGIIGTPDGSPADLPPGDPSGSQGTGTGTGILKEESFALSAAKAAETAIGSAEGSGKPPPKRTERAYPDDFEAAWKAYPHFRGRSSKPNALVAWRKLPQAERDAMIAAIERFRPKVRDVCGDKGAPDMARWLRDGKHLNWLDPAAEAVSVNPEAWPFMVAMWRRGDPWPPTAGPAPDRPDTLVPAHLLRDDAVLPALPEVH